MATRISSGHGLAADKLEPRPDTVQGDHEPESSREFCGERRSSLERAGADLLRRGPIVMA